MGLVYLRVRLCLWCAGCGLWASFNCSDLEGSAADSGTKLSRCSGLSSATESIGTGLRAEYCLVAASDPDTHLHFARLRAQNKIYLIANCRLITLHHHHHCGSHPTARS